MPSSWNFASFVKYELELSIYSQRQGSYVEQVVNFVVVAT